MTGMTFRIYTPQNNSWYARLELNNKTSQCAYIKIWLESLDNSRILPKELLCFCRSTSWTRNIGLVLSHASNIPNWNDLPSKLQCLPWYCQVIFCDGLTDKRAKGLSFEDYFYEFQYQYPQDFAKLQVKNKGKIMQCVIFQSYYRCIHSA